MLLILMIYKILIKYKNILYWFIIIFYCTYSFRYLSIYYKSNIDEKNNVNNTSYEENENAVMKTSLRKENIQKLDDNKKFETAAEY